jgi:methyl-accepting chemotaxis protein
MMDTLKTEIEQLFTELTEESESVNISSEALAGSQETYRQIIDLHWDFRTTQAYDLINSTSQEEYDALYAMLETSRGTIEAEMQETINRSNEQFVVVIGFLCGIGLLIVALWGWYLVRSIAGPIKQAVGYAQMIAEGDLSMDIKVVRKDEAGQLLAAFNTMLARLKAMLAEIEALTRAVQNGNLSVRGDAQAFAGGWRDLIEGMNTVIEAFVAPITLTSHYIDRIAKGDIPDKIIEEYQGDFNTIKDNLNNLIEATHDITRLAEALAEGNLTGEMHERSEHDNLMQALNAMILHVKSAITNVSDTANTIAAMSQQLSSGAEQLSNGAAAQAASMEESSSSMEEMAANIRQNSDNARQTEKIAVQSMEYAEETGRVVAETVVAMQQIAEKIAIIQDIANQTRMLSLNATIEAARAQDHGKAFSVVAAEVRQLSDTTKEAAEGIDKLATSSLDVSEKAGKMLATLVPSIRKTTELIMEISAATNEQSTGAEQVNRAIQQADQVTQQNATIAEETASSAEELSNQAQQLQRTISFFKIEKASREGTPNDKQQKTLSRLGKLKKKMRVYSSKTEHDAEYDDAESEPDNVPGDVSLDDEYDDDFERY